MASNHPGQCCTIGVKHEGEAKGEIKDIEGSEFTRTSLIHIQRMLIDTSLGILLVPKRWIER